MDPVKGAAIESEPMDGLLQLVSDLERNTAWLRREIERGDALMAEGFATTVSALSRAVAVSTAAWRGSLPDLSEPSVNPFGPVRLVGSSVQDAVERLTDEDLVELRSEFSWAEHQERREQVAEWFSRALRTIDGEMARRTDERR